MTERVPDLRTLLRAAQALPDLERPAGRRPPALLFAVYHLWRPCAWLTVFVVALPLAWARTRGGVVVPILVHCTMNALAFAALVWGALQR